MLYCQTQKMKCRGKTQTLLVGNTLFLDNESIRRQGRVQLSKLSRKSRSWRVQNFLQDQKILFRCPKISRLSYQYVNITKTSNKCDYLKMSSLTLKCYWSVNFHPNALELPSYSLYLEGELYKIT